MDTPKTLGPLPTQQTCRSRRDQDWKRQFYRALLNGQIRQMRYVARKKPSPKHRFIRFSRKSGKLNIDLNDPNRIETTPISKASKQTILKDQKNWLKQIDCGRSLEPATGALRRLWLNRAWQWLAKPNKTRLRVSVNP